MNNPVTVFATIKLAENKSEADLLAASAVFQTQFVAKEPGILRRELVRKPDGTYVDIVQFRSEADAREIMIKEVESDACRAFFAVMDMSDDDATASCEFNVTLETHI